MGLFDGSVSMTDKSEKTAVFESMWWCVSDRVVGEPGVFYCEDLRADTPHGVVTFGSMVYLNDGLRAFTFVPIVGLSRTGHMPTLSVNDDVDYLKRVVELMVTHGVACGVRVE